MNRKISNRNQRGGFTLVEMLVVVFIIAILAGLISAAAMKGLKRAKVAAIGVEINQLSMALEQYKQQFGEYPPDFAGLDGSGSAIDLAAKDRVIRHIAKAFPRFVISGADTAAKWAVLTPLIKNLDTMDPSKALSAWLGGMADGQGRKIGFSKDPANPFDITTPSRIGPFFEFDPGRLITQSTSDLGKYYPPGVIPGTGKPYVYFRAETGQGHPFEYLTITGSKPDYTLKKFPSDTSIAIIDSVKPYWDERTKCWVNDTSFQILCCGLDGKFGKENVFKSGLVKGAGVPDGTTPAGVPDLTADVIGTDTKTPTPFPVGNFDHLDDQTNFTSGTIGDDLP